MSSQPVSSGPQASASPMLGPLLSTALPVPFVAPELLPLLATIWIILLGASWALGRWNLQAIDCDAELPASAFAWEAVPVRLRVRNHSPTWAARDLLFGHVLSNDRVRRVRAYRPRLAAGAEVELRPTLRVPRRGRHTEYLVEVSSGFPFGLLRWRKQVLIETDLLGLPRLGELRRTEQVLPELLETAQQRHPQGTWRPGEFYALHEWRPGLPQRQIAWKASARRHQVLVQQNQVARRPTAHVIFHLGADLRRDRAGFERAVSLAATVVERLLRRRQPVRLTLYGSNLRTWSPRPGRDGLNQVLIALAEIQPDPATPAEIPRSLMMGSGTIVVHTGQAEVPATWSTRVRVLDARHERRLRSYFRAARAMPLRTTILRRA